jgi:hypothetical protein
MTGHYSAFRDRKVFYLTTRSFAKIIQQRQEMKEMSVWSIGGMTQRDGK